MDLKGQPRSDNVVEARRPRRFRMTPNYTLSGPPDPFARPMPNAFTNPMLPIAPMSETDFNRGWPLMPYDDAPAWAHFTEAPSNNLSFSTEAGRTARLRQHLLRLLARQP